MGLKKWALVLAGGGGKGFVQIGVLKALDDLGFKPSLIAGTSVGAMVGGCYCAGMSSLELVDFVTEDFDFQQYVDLHRIPGTGGINRVFQFGQAVKNFLSDTGIDSGEKIEAVLSELTKNKNFDELDIPFICNAADLLGARHKIFNEGNVAQAIRASLSLPGIFVPKVIGDSLYVDGGVYDNLLIKPVQELGFKRIISITMDPEEGVSVDSFKNCFDVIISAALIHSRSCRNETRLLSSLNINVWTNSPMSDFSNIPEKIERGYKAVMNHRRRLYEILR